MPPMTFVHPSPEECKRQDSFNLRPLDQLFMNELLNPEEYCNTDDPKKMNAYLMGLCQKAHQEILQLRWQVARRNLQLEVAIEALEASTCVFHLVDVRDISDEALRKIEVLKNG